MLGSVDPDELQSSSPDAEHLRRPEPLREAESRWAHDPVAPLSGLAGTIGNRGMARAVSRMRDGEGILPGGLVHPDVEAAIAAASGRGQQLESRLASDVGSVLGDSVSDVRIHHDDHAAALSRAVSARAFTVGRDVFFGAGEYRPSAPGGRELLTHELAHVVQQRGAPQTGPLMVSKPGEALELEAESAARRLG
jgi:Domain of unknown function (DUF4157)